MEKQWEEVKHKLNIVDVIGSYIPLQKAGRNFRALCPFHQEKTPSFMVSPELQIFKCFGCGAGGDVFEFVKQIEGVEFPEALKILADKAGVKLREWHKDKEAPIKERVLEINQRAAQAFDYFLLKHQVGEKAREYLKKRGLTPETIKKFGLGYAPRSWETLGKYLLKLGFNLSDLSLAGLVTLKEKGKFFDFFRGRIIFPLKDVRGQVIGFSARALEESDTPKYINSVETPVFRKGEFLYGLSETKQEIKKAGKALVVEGEFDLLGPYQKGITNIVALKGTAFTLKQLELLGRYSKTLELFLDSDEAGLSAALKSAFLAQDLGFKVRVATAKDAKDPDELSRADFATFQNIVAHPKEIYDFALETLGEKYDLRSGAEKREFSQKALEILVRIKDPVERHHYVSKLSLMIETDVSLLEGLIDQYQKQAKSQSPLLPKPAAMVIKSSLSKEEYFLALLFKSPLEEAQKLIFKAGKGDFSSKINLEVFESFKSYVTGRKTDFNAGTFRKNLGERGQAVFDTLYMIDLSFLEEPKPVWEKEGNYVLRELKKEAVKKELKRLTFEIKRLEQASEPTKKIQKEFKGLSEKLSVLSS